MAAGDVYELTVVGQLNLQRCVNVFHFKEKTSDSTTNPAKSVAVMFDEEFIPTWRLAISNQWDFNCIYSRRVLPGPGIPFLHTLAGATVGAIASESVPGNASACMSFKSNEPGPSGRGRKYIAGVPENGQQAGIMSDPQMTLFLTFAGLFEVDDLNGSIGGGTYTPVIFSRTLQASNRIMVADFSRSIATMSSRRAPFGMIP